MPAVLTKDQEIQEWVDRIFGFVIVQCDFCDEDMEVPDDAEPNDDGLWKCKHCSETENNLW